MPAQKIKHILIIIGIILASFAGASLNAQTEAEQLQRAIQEKNANIEQLNREIKEFEALADKTGQEAKTLQARIKQLENNAKSIDLEIRKIREKIEAANLDIRRLDLNIDESESKVDMSRKSIAESIRNMYMSDQTNLVEILLNNQNLSTTLEEINSQMNFSAALQRLIEESRREQAILSNSKLSQEEKKQELVKLQEDLSGQRKAVDYTKSEQDKILKETKNQEQEYQRILKDKVALRAATEKELFDFESKLKYTLDPTSIPQAGSGPLQWPLDDVRITQQFGRTVAAQRLYVSGSHNGMDFGAKIGTPVKSVQSGVVMGQGDTDIACKGASFGRWILVRHNNGLSSLYAHLSVINVKAGQQVAAGEVIGLSGNTGYSTGPHLHLGIYAADAVQVQDRPSISCGGRVYTMPIAPIEAYLDPALYLPKK